MKMWSGCWGNPSMGVVCWGGYIVAPRQVVSLYQLVPFGIAMLESVGSFVSVLSVQLCSAYVLYRYSVYIYILKNYRNIRLPEPKPKFINRRHSILFLEFVPIPSGKRPKSDLISCLPNKCNVFLVPKKCNDFTQEYTMFHAHLYLGHYLRA
jgi:hypothetical protein